LISLVFCLLGIILSTIFWPSRTSLLKAISIIILIASILMMMLYLFSLM
jgi:preprotein translocase subunit SecE